MGWVKYIAMFLLCFNSKVMGRFYRIRRLSNPDWELERASNFFNIYNISLLGTVFFWSFVIPKENYRLVLSLCLLLFLETKYALI